MSILLTPVSGKPNTTLLEVGVSDLSSSQQKGYQWVEQTAADVVTQEDVI